MHAHIHHDAGRAQPLGIEHPHTVTRIFVETELGHECFGVERPAFPVPGHPVGLPAPRIELILEVNGQAKLEVMTRYALVVDGGLFLPGVEFRDAFRHRPPHAAGP